MHHRQTPSYDSLGRLSQAIECVGAESEGCTDYTTGYDYDEYSRLQLTTLHGGKEVFREYNNNILQKLKRGENGSLIWQMNNIDARGRPQLETAGNGVQTRYTYNYANNQWGMLSNIRVNNNVKDIMHRAYGYDSTNAQLVMRRDMLPNTIGDFILPTVIETFTYDKHRRIATNNFNYGGTQSESFTYKYDELGNLTSKPDAGLENYTYGQGITVDNAGPHAIKSVDGRDFTYDASGNLLNDGEREARWKSFEKPEMLRKIGGATIWFEYGAGNTRKRRRQGNFNTWYLDGGADVQIERLTNNNNSEVTTKYHYVANGNVVGIDEETDSGTESRYLHSDRLGSASVLTDALGSVIEKMSYDVWGQVRSVTSGGISSVLKSQYHTKSYTGHEALADVDLVHMNGRIYDPILGRFMSADPFVQFTFNSQSYNRYSYVLNNPLGATDPTGYFSISETLDTVVEGVRGTWNDVKSAFGGGAESDIGNESGISNSGRADMLSDNEIRERIVDPSTGKVVENAPDLWVENIRYNLKKMRRTVEGRAMLRSIIRNNRNFQHGGDVLPTRSKIHNAFDLNLNSPNFFTQREFREAVREEIRPDRQAAASTEMLGVNGDTILGHEEANFQGVGEAATILLVEGPMRDANGTPRRSTDRGQPLTEMDDGDKIDFRDLQILVDAARE